MQGSKGSGRPSVLAMNPDNVAASAARRTRLLAAFDSLPEDDRADLLAAVESLTSALTPGASIYREEAHRVILLAYQRAGWDS